MEEAKQDGQGAPGAPDAVVVKIGPERVQALFKADQSIQFWAVKHVDLSLELRGIEATVHGLREHKSQIMAEALKEIGVDIKKFAHARMGPDGTVQLVPAPPSASPADQGQPAQPAQPSA